MKEIVIKVSDVALEACEKGRHEDTAYAVLAGSAWQDITVREYEPFKPEPVPVEKTDGAGSPFHPHVYEAQIYSIPGVGLYENLKFAAVVAAKQNRHILAVRELLLAVGAELWIVQVEGTRLELVARVDATRAGEPPPRNPSPAAAGGYAYTVDGIEATSCVQVISPQDLLRLAGYDAKIGKYAELYVCGPSPAPGKVDLQRAITLSDNPKWNRFETRPVDA